jgi:recombination protein RecA
MSVKITEKESVQAFDSLEPEVQGLVEQAAEKAVQKISPDETLAYILKAVKKEKGDKVVVKGSEVPDVERIPTGCFEFDLGTGGGIPKGRITIVYGPESSGKTNIALKAIAYVQKYFPPECNKCVFVDVEHSFDPTWAAKMGVDVEALIVVKPAYGEEAIDIVDALIRAGDLALMVVDSIAVLVSSKEVQQSVEKFDVGTSALLVKRMCNKLVIALASEERKNHFPAVILINQTRFKIGVMFGDPETMPGGVAMKFMSALTVRLYGKNIVDKKIHPDLPVWKETHAVIKKAKVPVNAVNFEYNMAMIPAEDLDIGDTDSWNTVSGYLKVTGSLAKENQGWTLKMDNFQESLPTLTLWREQYVCDLGFRVACQQHVVKSIQNQKFLVQESHT